MKKAGTLVLFFLFSCLLSAAALGDMPEISSQSAIVFCAETGDTLYARYADERMLIASTTKIMTAIVAIERLDTEQSYEIQPDWCGIEGSSMYLEAGQRYTVHELLIGMLLNSGNDAATALSCITAGSEEGFAELMNAKAAELGLTDTSFKNPHGLDADGHYSTAKDLAALTAYCMENEEFRSIVSMSSASVGGLCFYNHNKLLNMYKGCIGVKTGYTMAAGRTLVSCVERRGMRLICVTLNAPDDWNDHIKLYDWCLESFELTKVSAESFLASVPIQSDTFDSTLITPEETLYVLTGKNDSVRISMEIPPLLYTGVRKGEKAGELFVFVNGALAASTKMVYTEDIPLEYSLRLSMLRLASETVGPYYIEKRGFADERAITEDNILRRALLSPRG